MREPSLPVAESSLLRAIGVLGLAAGIVNVTVGGGIFRLPADVARGLGAAAPLAYLVCAIAMGLIVVCFAEAGSRVDLTGGPYAYVETAFGPFLGFQAGVLVWVLATMAVAAVSVVFATNAAELLPALKGEWASRAFLVLVFLVLSAVNIAGVRRGTALNTAATVAKLLPLLFLAAAAPFFVDPRNLAWAHAPSAQAVSRTSVLLIFAFCGVESALLPSGEVKDSARTVPRAIFVAMAGITVLYVALQVTAQGILGEDLGSSPTPLADAAGRMLGPAGRTLLLGGATVSMFGYVSGMILAVPRALFAFARDGFLPAPLASVHARYHTPHVAIVVQSVVVCAFALTSTFERLVILANLAVLVLYALCCLSAWQLRRSNVRTGGVPFQVKGAALAPPAALLVIAWMLTSVRRDEWTALAAALATATVVFFLTARTRRARQGPTTALRLEEAR
jgi:APA family basic amino acid/polyamine antiporter